MNSQAFVETEHVSALRDAIEGAKAAGIGIPSIVMAYGEAGTGKTVAARKLHAALGGVYLRALEGMSQSAFLQALCFEITGTRLYRTAHAKTAILAELAEEPTLIFLDEIDRLHVSRMEDLRDINDITGSPIIFIGEMGLPARVRARTRINDRIPEAFRINFASIQYKDILLYAKKAANLHLSPEAASLVGKATKGNFRRIHNAILLLDKAAKAANIQEINADMAQSVITQKRAR